MVSQLVVGQNTWASLAYANQLLDDLPIGTTWADQSDDDKARALINWYRTLEVQGWQGTLAAVNVVSAVAVAAGGTGYSVGDILTVSGGTAGRAAKAKVTSVSGGVVDGVVLTDVGSYTADPTSPAATTGGGGSGATLTLTLADQSTQFPRTGLSCGGYSLPSNDVPQRVVDANVILAQLGIDNPNLLTEITTGSNEKRLKAGEVEIENFLPTLLFNATRLPPIVHELLSCILATSQGGIAIVATGTGATSVFSDSDAFGLTEGYS